MLDADTTDMLHTSIHFFVLVNCSSQGSCNIVSWLLCFTNSILPLVCIRRAVRTTIVWVHCSSIQRTFSSASCWQRSWPWTVVGKFHVHFWKWKQLVKSITAANGPLHQVVSVWSWSSVYSCLAVTGTLTEEEKGVCRVFGPGTGFKCGSKGGC